MSVLATHRTAVIGLLLGVPHIGQVHGEEQFARQELRFRELYTYFDGTKTQVRGWHVSRVRTTETGLGVGRTLNAHTWSLRGYMAFDSDADSGRAFDELIELVRQAWRADETLGGAVQPGPLNNPSGVQVVDSGPVMFAGVLCHAATLQLTTYAYLSTGE